MNLLWLLGIPAIMWLWAVSVPLTLEVLYGKGMWTYDSWWRGPTYFVFNTCTAIIGLLGIAICLFNAFN